MRPLLLTDADVWAGTERHMLDLALALREMGVGAALSCPARVPLAQRAAREALPLLSIAKGGALDGRAVQTLHRALRRGACDLLHAHNGRTHLSAALATTLARRGAVVFTQHFIEPHHLRQSGPKSAAFARVHRWVNARTHRFIAISEEVAAAMRARGDAPANRLRVVPNGIGDPRRAALTAPETVRQRYGVAPDAPLWVCAARLAPEKDHASLLSAWERLRPDFPAARLLLAGRGALEGELRARVAAPIFGASVQVIGFVEDAWSLLNAADALVLAAPREPFGLVFLEAMALGKAVVACRGGAAPEIVADGATGLLAAPRSPQELAGAMETLLREPRRARALGDAGRARFESHFTRDLMAARVREVYEGARRDATRGAT